jgi:hypothetical protein
MVDAWKRKASFIVNDLSEAAAHTLYEQAFA